MMQTMFSSCGRGNWKHCFQLARFGPALLLSALLTFSTMAQAGKIRPSTQSILNNFEARKGKERQKEVNALKTQQAQAAAIIKSAEEGMPSLASVAQESQAKLQRILAEKESHETAHKQAMKDLNALEDQILSSAEATARTAPAEAAFMKAIQGEEEALAAVLDRPVTGVKTKSEWNKLTDHLTLQEKNRLKSNAAYTAAGKETRAASDALAKIRKEILTADSKYQEQTSQLKSTEDDLKQIQGNQKQAVAELNIARKRLDVVNKQMQVAKVVFQNAQARLKALGE